jgi:hypothetical protein
MKKRHIKGFRKETKVTLLKMKAAVCMMLRKCARLDSPEKMLWFEVLRQMIKDFRDKKGIMRPIDTIKEFDRDHFETMKSIAGILDIDASFLFSILKCAGMLIPADQEWAWEG